MDLRVLVGVFVTLFGIAVGMAGGDIQGQQLADTVQDTMRSGELPSLTTLSGFLNRYTSKPANTSIHADLTTAEAVTISVKHPATLMLHVAPGATLQTGDATLSLDDDTANTVTLRGFTGDIESDGNVSVDGAAQRVQTPGTTLNYSRNTPVSIAAGTAVRIVTDDLTQQPLSFEDAEGTITTGSTEMTLSGESAVFESFEGNLTIQATDPARYELHGRVYRGLLRSGESQITIGHTK